MYLHCHNCGWDNDDYFETYGGNKGYWNYHIKHHIGHLFDWGEVSYKNDSETDDFTKCSRWFPIWESLNHLYRLNFKQLYKTHDEFRSKNPNWICPKCKAKALDVD